jgi:hypothetical protein
VAEWLKAPHSKCGIRVTVSGVRIPPSPPYTLEIVCAQRKAALIEKIVNPPDQSNVVSIAGR